MKEMKGMTKKSNRPVGRPKGSGGKQPNWKYTDGRKRNLAKARKVAARMRKKAGVAILNKENMRKFNRQR